MTPPPDLPPLDVEVCLSGVRDATAALLDGLRGLTDDEARRPSLLPGWTVGHVLTHLARNADGVRGMIEGATRDLSIPMWGPDAADPLPTCKPIGIEVYDVPQALLAGWSLPQASDYAGFFGLKQPVWGEEG